MASRSSRRLVLAAAAAPVGAVAVAVWRRRSAVGAPAGRRTVPCACGQQFEVTGLDRHRVYWLERAHESDPVLGRQCPVCDAPLPSERDAPAAAASR